MGLNEEKIFSLGDIVIVHGPEYRLASDLLIQIRYTVYSSIWLAVSSLAVCLRLEMELSRSTFLWDADRYLLFSYLVGIWFLDRGARMERPWKHLRCFCIYTAKG